MNQSADATSRPVSTGRPASSAIVERNGTYLLVRRRNPPAADLYAFPGGRGEPGETPDVTALRELQEETGLAGENPRLFATYDLKPEAGGRPEHHFFLSVFLVDVPGETEAVADDDAADLGWYSTAEILALPAPDSVHECVRRLVRRTKSV